MTYNNCLIPPTVGGNDTEVLWNDNGTIAGTTGTYDSVGNGFVGFNYLSKNGVVADDGFLRGGTSWAVAVGLSATGGNVPLVRWDATTGELVIGYTDTTHGADVWNHIQAGTGSWGVWDGTTQLVRVDAANGMRFASLASQPNAPSDGVRVYAFQDFLKGRTQNSTIATIVPEGSVNSRTRLESYRLGPTEALSGEANTVIGQVSLATLTSGMTSGDQIFVDVIVAGFCNTEGDNTAYGAFITLTAIIKYNSTGPTYTLGNVASSTISVTSSGGGTTLTDIFTSATLDMSGGNLRLVVECPTLVDVFAVMNTIAP